VSLLIQRSSSRAACRNIFLFPDGSGSGSSYRNLPWLGANFSLYVLQCPYLRHPEGYRCGIEVVTEQYFAEIRRRQPEGPYFLGGWSVGGVLAFEAARQLIQAGDRVEHLVLIDSPCPTALAPMPPELIIYLDSIGMFNFDASASASLVGTRDRVLQHFETSVANLQKYKPGQISAGVLSTVTCIWAESGVRAKSVQGHTPLPVELATNETAVWILYDRTDSGPRGWEALLPGVRLDVRSVPGNHFSIMQTPNVRIPSFSVSVCPRLQRGAPSVTERQC
jgi:thioesterase domain-containing protein